MATAQASLTDADARQRRRRRGDFATPPDLVRRIVDAVMPPIVAGQRVSVLDPACGDGRFLAAAAEHIAGAGGVAVLHGIDIAPDAVGAARAALAPRGGAQVEVGDALSRDWGDATYELVVGNPPYLSQLAAATSRGRASAHGGGPYADVAAEFLALSVALARPAGGRVGLLLPQSVLGSRDAGPLRAQVEQLAEPIWSWWSPRLHFDASVFVCAVGFERGELSGNPQGRGGDRDPVWTGVVTRAMGVPDTLPVAAAGTVADHATLTANFRDEYYGLIPAVGDHRSGPLFVTSGAIDPDLCRWGERPVTFNRRRFQRPRVDVSQLDERMRRWARRLAVPKVLIANQTRIVECVVDRPGTMLPAVPVLTARPTIPGNIELSAIAAVLSSPLASVWLWHAAAGTGLSARTVRLRPAQVAAVPWPQGSLTSAIAAYDAGDLVRSARAVHDAYGIGQDDGDRLLRWWAAWSPSLSPRDRAA
jgi:SAM-dependent methyltransferase